MTNDRIIFDAYLSRQLVAGELTSRDASRLTRSGLTIPETLVEMTVLVAQSDYLKTSNSRFGDDGFIYNVISVNDRLKAHYHCDSNDSVLTIEDARMILYIFFFMSNFRYLIQLV